MLVQHGNPYERVPSKYRWVSFSCLPTGRHTISYASDKGWEMSMTPEKALDAVRIACDSIAGYVGNGISSGDYEAFLKTAAKKQFPGADWESEMPGGGKNIEHTLHHILFGAGFDMEFLSDGGLVKRNGYKHENIEAGIERYKGFIIGLSPLL